VFVESHLAFFSRRNKNERDNVLMIRSVQRAGMWWRAQPLIMCLFSVPNFQPHQGRICHRIA